MKMSALLAIAAVGASSAVALATPTINGAKINSRVYNDNSASNLTVTNNYPSLVQFNDQNLTQGFANRHNFRVSGDAGATAQQFANSDAFAISADVTIDGPGNGEGGLQVSPWYSANVDGQFNLRAGGNGEVAVFGGRLPFYSFTSNFGVTYTKGTTVRLSIQYVPNDLTAGSPGRIQYGYGNLVSPWLAFNANNPAEVAVYGDYGTLNNAQVGGFVQVLGGASGQNGLTASFANIAFDVPAPGAAGLMGLAGLLAARRRR